MMVYEDKDRIRHLALLASKMANNGVLEELTNAIGEDNKLIGDTVFIFALGDARISTVMPSIEERGENPVNVIVYTDGDTMIQSIRFTKIADPHHVLPEMNPMSSLEKVIASMGQKTYMSYNNQGYLISYNGHYAEDDIDADQQ